MPFGILEQHRHEALRGRKIAGQERNRAGALSEGVAQRDGMIQGDRFFDTSLGGRYRLIRVALEPEDRREPRTGRHPWIELEADDVELVNGGAWAIEHTLDVAPRLCLVAEEMQREARHPITDRGGERIGGLRGSAREGLRKRHRLPDIAAIHAIDPQAPERPQAIVGVIQPVSDLERAGKRGPRFRNGAFRVHERRAQRGQELHFAPPVSARGGPEAAERLRHAPSALLHEREVRPQRHDCDRQRHAGSDIPTRGKRPVQGRTHVVDLLAIGGHPFGHGPRPQLCVALFEQSPEVLRMAPGEGCQLATLTELLAGVGARRLEQAVLHGELAGMGRHERPGDQARDAV